MIMGVDPLSVFRSLLETVHGVTLAKVGTAPRHRAAAGGARCARDLGGGTVLSLAPSAVAVAAEGGMTRSRRRRCRSRRRRWRCCARSTPRRCPIRASWRGRSRAARSRRRRGRAAWGGARAAPRCGAGRGGPGCGGPESGGPGSSGSAGCAGDAVLPPTFAQLIDRLDEEGRARAGGAVAAWRAGRRLCAPGAGAERQPSDVRRYAGRSERCAEIADRAAVARIVRGCAGRTHGARGGGTRRRRRRRRRSWRRR